MEYTPFYRTKDRFEIFVLLAVHCQVDGCEREQNGVVYFRFADKKKCEEILSLFLSKKLKVYAHDFVNAVRDAQAIFKNK